jgi:hypothetical protein
MANDFDALRERVASARAAAAGSIRVPQVPPDESAAPWATARPPGPQKAQETRPIPLETVLKNGDAPLYEIAPPKPENKNGKVTRMQGRAKEPPQEQAWKLIDTILNKYAKMADESLGRANTWLASQWVRNATFFIRNNLPLEEYESVIKTSVALRKDNLGEAEEDARIELIRQQGMRDLDGFTNAENDGGEEEE